MEQLEKLAAFTAGFHLEDAPEAVVEAAKACVLDTVSVAIGAGSNQMYCGIKQVYLLIQKSNMVMALIQPALITKQMARR